MHPEVLARCCDLRMFALPLLGRPLIARGDPASTDKDTAAGSGLRGAVTWALAPGLAHESGQIALFPIPKFML